MIIVERTDPHHPQATALLKQSHALMQSLFPPEDNHYLPLDALRAPDIHFFVARSSSVAQSRPGGCSSNTAGVGQVLGCGALAVREGYGELKSMYTDESARKLGVATQLLQVLEAEASAQRLPYLRLETGSKLHAALSFYRKSGFEQRGPFGRYEENQTSLFMEKALRE